MNKFLIPITNDQLNQLINFGKIYIPGFLVIKFNDTKLPQTKLADIFIKYIQFKYDEEYLVLEGYSKVDTTNNLLQVNVEDIENVYPISQECLQALSYKHPQIRFHKPIFSVDSLERINDAFFISDSQSGVNCLKSIWNDLGDEPTIILDDAYKASLKLRKKRKLKDLQADATLADFVFLYTYQAYYPLNTLGYFYRTAEILTKKTLALKSIPYRQEILENSEIFKILEYLKLSQQDASLKDIIDFLEKDDKSQKFIENLSSDGVRYYIVIPMFLKILDEFNDHNQILENTSLEKAIKYYKAQYLNECKLLIAWLGAYLGYGNCYEYFYSKKNLKIFQTYKKEENVMLISKVEQEALFDSGNNQTSETTNGGLSLLAAPAVPKNINDPDNEISQKGGIIEESLHSPNELRTNVLLTDPKTYKQMMLNILKANGGQVTIPKMIKELKPKHSKLIISQDDVFLFIESISEDVEIVSNNLKSTHIKVKGEIKKPVKQSKITHDDLGATLSLITDERPQSD
jgi:hypothetical protein